MINFKHFVVRKLHCFLHFLCRWPATCRNTQHCTRSVFSVTPDAIAYISYDLSHSFQLADALSVRHSWPGGFKPDTAAIFRVYPTSDTPYKVVMCSCIWRNAARKFNTKDLIGQHAITTLLMWYTNKRQWMWYTKVSIHFANNNNRRDGSFERGWLTSSRKGADGL